MRTKTSQKMINNEKGFVLATSMLFLLVLTIVGIAATNTTTIELDIAGNDRFAKEDFYNQETNLMNGKLNFRDWLTLTYLTTAENAAFFPAAGTDATDANANGINDLSEFVDTNGTVLGSYKVRNMLSIPTDIAGWDDIADYGDAADHPANIIPARAHRGKPDPGSGYDPKNSEFRRFAITAYSPNADRKIVLQEGVFKAFNRF